MNTSLPTEPGTYLFCGSREGRVELPNLGYKSIEVVRVTRKDSGELRFVGMDFFYHPEKAIGTWFPISDVSSTLMESTQKLFIDKLARDTLSQFAKYRTSKEYILKRLIAFFRSDGIELYAEQVFDYAVAQKIIIPGAEPGYWVAV